MPCAQTDVDALPIGLGSELGVAARQHALRAGICTFVISLRRLAIWTPSA